MDNSSIYLDHAATTFPRPPEILKQMFALFAQMGCSPGRGGYDMAVEVERFIKRVRHRVAGYFGAIDPNRVVFTANATDALNLAILGMTRPGTHVVSTRLEHNSVLRPLHHLKDIGRIEYTLVAFDSGGFVDPDSIAAALRNNTCLVVVNHASNVLGSIQPIAEIGRICAERGVPLLIDTAQSAGYVSIDMSAWNLSAVAFTGHKALLGPTGIGGLVTAPGVEVEATRFGGTGVDSHRLSQPEYFPHHLETGTLNLLGIIGLDVGLEYLEKSGPLVMYRQKMTLLSRLWKGLSDIEAVTVYGSVPSDRHVPLMSCNISGINPNDAGMILDGDYDIAVRTGLHCAPYVHEDTGTAPHGSIRFSLGWNTTDEDVESAIEAVNNMATRR
jgi:cysteine desulfurase / selenocysteine lyase